MSVNLKGESRAEIYALPVFELLPFVLIENGIKYSPSNQKIDVCFEQNGRRQSVIVKSMGPSATRANFLDYSKKALGALML